MLTPNNEQQSTMTNVAMVKHAVASVLIGYINGCTICATTDKNRVAFNIKDFIATDNTKSS